MVRRKGLFTLACEPGNGVFAFDGESESDRYSTTFAALGGIYYDSALFYNNNNNHRTTTTASHNSQSLQASRKTISPRCETGSTKKTELGCIFTRYSCFLILIIRRNCPYAHLFTHCNYFSPSFIFSSITSIVPCERRFFSFSSF